MGRKCMPTRWSTKTASRPRIITYGAILTELHVPDRDGKLGDVVLGHDKLEDYLDGHPYFGATTGRVANRIAKAKFTLDGKEYTLAVNNGPNHLHGGNEKAISKTGLESQDGQERARPRRHVQPHQPRRRGRLPRRAQNESHLHADRCR